MSEFLHEGSGPNEDAQPEDDWMQLVDTVDEPHKAAELTPTAHDPNTVADDDRAERARRRDSIVLEIVQRYRDHPSMPSRTARFLDPVDPTSLSLSPRVRFFQEMEQYRLLSVADERELFQAIDAGVLLYEHHGGFVQNGKDAEEIFLETAAAHEMLILSNLRLVAKIAFRYVWLNAMPLTDLINEGVLGLGTAVRRFDLSRNGKLSTFATWWIRSYITRAIRDRGRMIRIPAYMHERVTRFYRMTSELVNELERNPTADDIADAYGDMSAGELAEMQRIHGLIPDSLNRMIDDEETELEDLVAGSDNERQHMQTEHRDLVQRLLSDQRLTERERYVLRRRYGFDDGQSRTLEEVGDELEITRERVRQIETRALRKMRRQLGLPADILTPAESKRRRNVPAPRRPSNE